MEKLGWEAKIDSLYLLGDISWALMPFQTSAFQQDRYTVFVYFQSRTFWDTRGRLIICKKEERDCSF